MLFYRADMSFDAGNFDNSGRIKKLRGVLISKDYETGGEGFKIYSATVPDNIGVGFPGPFNSHSIDGLVGKVSMDYWKTGNNEVGFCSCEATRRVANDHLDFGVFVTKSRIKSGNGYRANGDGTFVTFELVRACLVYTTSGEDNQIPTDLMTRIIPQTREPRWAIYGRNSFSDYTIVKQ